MCSGKIYWSEKKQYAFGDVEIQQALVATGLRSLLILHIGIFLVWGTSELPFKLSNPFPDSSWGCAGPSPYLCSLFPGFSGVLCPYPT